MSLPKTFANTAVIIEQVSDTELRIRKARTIPEEELRFAEESGTTVLSERDRDVLLNLLDSPPAANEALREAAAAYLLSGRVMLGPVRTN